MSVSPLGKNVISAFRALSADEQVSVLQKLLPHARVSARREARETDGAEDKPLPDWLSLDEAAEWMDVNKSSVSRYAKNGHKQFGKLIAIGGHWNRKIYSWSAFVFEMRKFIKECQKQPPVRDCAEPIRLATELVEWTNRVHLEVGIDLFYGTYHKPDRLPPSRPFSEFWSEIDRLRSP